MAPGDVIDDGSGLSHTNRLTARTLPKYSLKHHPAIGTSNGSKRLRKAGNQGHWPIDFAPKRSTTA